MKIKEILEKCPSERTQVDLFQLVELLNEIKFFKDKNIN